jgi:prepilin-type N-terminal cleavage/methylation domain-containing protein
MLPANNRHGFTLVELMIVVAIIAVLMGLSLSVMSGLTSQAEQEATNATIRKIDALLLQRMEAFNRAFKDARLDAAVGVVSATLANQKIFGVRDEVKEILAKKRAMRFEFPQRFEERNYEEGPSLVTGTNPDPQVISDDLPNSLLHAIALPNARQRFADMGRTGMNDTEIMQDPEDSTQGVIPWFRNNHRPETESSELLYFALTASTSYGVPPVDTDYFTNREVADTDGDGLPEFIDAWGRPLRYYRWPTRLIDITAPNPFLPNLANQSDNTDTRVIGGAERQITSLLVRGLTPPPITLPNGALPRDLLLIDPDDPVGRLYSELERLDGSDGNTPFSKEFNEGNYHTPETFHAPLIVSAGPDEALGLYEPTETDPNGGVFGNLAQLDGTNTFTPIDQDTIAALTEILSDNISNLNRRAGGRR